MTYPSSSRRVRISINPDVLPTPLRESLRGRCSHQVEYLVSRFLQVSAIDPVVPACVCQPAIPVQQSREGILDGLPASAWAAYVNHEYGGEG